MLHRKSAYAMNKKEQDAFKKAITEMIADGIYAKLVAWHTDMKKYKMHQGNGITGGRRFLGWHRAYLKIFEDELRKKEAGTFVPYLDWKQLNSKAEVPHWLQSAEMKPDIDLTATTAIPSFRKKYVNKRNDKPNVSKFRYKGYISKIIGSDNYNDFTYELERHPHNSGHVILGFPMTKMASPADPIFWMHHAMVDKIWADWQKKHPKKHPKWTGSYSGGEILTPFKKGSKIVTYDAVKNISNTYLDYEYV